MMKEFFELEKDFDFSLKEMKCYTYLEISGLIVYSVMRKLVVFLL